MEFTLNVAIFMEPVSPDEAGSVKILGMGAKVQVEVGGKHLTLSNLDKVLYPGNGFAKAHVIDYYTKVSKWMLPHLARRAVSMNRFPDGVNGKAFYEKDAPDYLPEWAHTTNVPRQAGGDPIRYITIDDLPTLVWCANLASLELHLFLHRAENLDRPDSIVFDLDPGEGVDLVDCAEVAFLLRALLEKNGLQAFPKVSGSKGLQLYVPLNTAVTYQQTRNAAQGVAQMLARQNPSLVVADMAKQLRKQKVFIDWSQNSDFKTTIGVYSLRAKSDLPYVSAPVTWDELDELLKHRDPTALRFEATALIERLDDVGDLFAPLLTLTQTLTPITEHGSVKVQGTPAKALQFVEPMLLLKTANLPEGSDWIYEIKLDGYRALAVKSNGNVSFRSRNDNDFGARFSPIVQALQNMPDETIIDGELVALDEEGKPSFSLLQNHRSSQAPIVYYVFDILTLDGRSLIDQPLSKRRKVLEEKVLVRLSEPIRYSPQLDAPLPDLISSVKSQGLEGLIAKRRDSVYEPGLRSGAWQKMRVNEGQELVIGGYTPSAKNFDALVIGYYENDQLLYAARTRNGFTPALRESLFKKLQPLEIDSCPFANLPEKKSGRWGQGLTASKMKECRWLKPVTVAQFEFVEWTPENHLRHSKFVALREDKEASAVKREA